MEVLEIIGAVVVLFGSISLLLAAVGLYRMPDFYNRIQVGTKASTFGVLLTIIGLLLIFPGWTGKLIALLVFVLITNPISSHIIARAAYFTGVPLSKLTKVDEMKKEVSEGHLKKVNIKE